VGPKRDALENYPKVGPMLLGELTTHRNGRSLPQQHHLVLTPADKRTSGTQWFTWKLPRRQFAAGLFDKFLRGLI
jgi:hypothetical protein